MIEVENLTKTFGSYHAVDHISFGAQKGEIVGLLGPNGAGKTTIMRMLTGFMPPSDGTAEVSGFDVVKDSLEVRRRVGYLPEQVPVYPDMTVYGYIKFWAELRGMRRPHERVMEVIEQVQLTQRHKSLIRNLSKGMRQRLGLAQALVHDPEVVILDEPTIGIDPQQVIEVRESVRALGQNHTVLFSTHILSEAEQVCDRVLILHQGHVLAEGPPDRLRHILQPEEHLYVVIRGASEEKALALLHNINGVESVESSGEGYNLRVREGKDIRGDLSDRIAGAGFQLLELRPVAMTLEDIFLDLVGRMN